MWILILIGIALLLFTIMVSYNTAYDVAKKKGYEFNTKVRLMCLVPIYGIFYSIKLPILKVNVLDEEIKYLYSGSQIAFRTLISFLILIGLTVIVAILSLTGYLSLTNLNMSNISTLILMLIFGLLAQGLTVEFAGKKGYEGLIPGLIGLIPLGVAVIVNLILGLPNLGFLLATLINIVMTGLLCTGTMYYYSSVVKRRNISKRALMATFSPKNIFKKFLIYGEISLLAIVVIIPVVYIFGMAFSNLKSDIPNQIWPANPSWDAFFFLFNPEESKFTTWYMNTLWIAIINMVVGTLIITGASYVFARFSFKGKKAGLLTILVLQAFPSFMGLLAMYVLFWRFGLLGQPMWLSILYIGGSIPGNLWLIKGFLSQIPKDLDESAMIDGASKVQTFMYIILPLAIPILTFVAVSMFMGPWMDYMLPGYLLNFMPEGAPVGYDVQNQWTLAVGIFDFINNNQNLNYSAFAAAALIVGLPIALIYMIFQRYLIEGIMAGATKG